MAKKSKKATSIKLSLQDKTLIELKEMLKKTQAEWVKLRMDFKVGKVKDIHSPMKKRKEIARIKTKIREK
ncbi:50S ribosomal protein L29, partial [Patescibacteria group bacterium]